MNGESEPYTPKSKFTSYALPVIYARNRRPRGTSANTLNAARFPAWHGSRRTDCARPVCQHADRRSWPHKIHPS